MAWLRYKLVSPIRLLLPFTGVLLSIPFIFKDLLMFTTIPLFYFIGMYFFLLNFPGIAEALHKKPLYLEDLIDTRETGQVSNYFQRAYSISMNFILATLFAGLAEYVIFQGIREKPLMEIFAIIGGNISLFMKFQNILGKILLYIFHHKKHRLSEDLSGIEIQLEIN